MVEQRCTVAPAEAVTRRRWRHALGDRVRVIEHPANDLCRNLSHARRLDVIVEQIGDHPPGAGRGKTVQQKPLTIGHPAAVQTHIGPARLTPLREHELVHIGTEVANPIQRRSRRVRDHRHIGRADTLPCWRTGIELKPCRPQPKVIRLSRPSDPVDTVRDTLDQPIAREARKRTHGNPSLLRLLARAKTPLSLGDVEESLERPRHTAKYINSSIVRSGTR